MTISCVNINILLRLSFKCSNKKIILLFSQHSSQILVRREKWHQLFEQKNFKEFLNSNKLSAGNLKDEKETLRYHVRSNFRKQLPLLGLREQRERLRDFEARLCQTSQTSRKEGSLAGAGRSELIGKARKLGSRPLKKQWLAGVWEKCRLVKLLLQIWRKLQTVFRTGDVRKRICCRRGEKTLHSEAHRSPKQPRGSLEVKGRSKLLLPPGVLKSAVPLVAILTGRNLASRNRFCRVPGTGEHGREWIWRWETINK